MKLQPDVHEVLHWHFIFISFLAQPLEMLWTNGRTLVWVPSYTTQSSHSVTITSLLIYTWL